MTILKLICTTAEDPALIGLRRRTKPLFIIRTGTKKALIAFGEQIKTFQHAALLRCNIVHCSY